MKAYEIDERRSLVLPGNHDETLYFAVEEWVRLANEAIAAHGFFTVALSGGSTPKKIFEILSSDHRDDIDWNKVYLFWSDERAVAPTDPDSNYHMAMVEGRLNSLHIHENHIFRMVAEKDRDKNAKLYERQILENVKRGEFDLIMLGMGDDGHTASLFPQTEALNVKDQLVVPNYVPQKKSWRMTFTYPLINKARKICLYVLGEAKADILAKVLFSPLDFEQYPSQNVGTKEHKATWIIDEAAAENLLVKLR